MRQPGPQSFWADRPDCIALNFFRHSMWILNRQELFRKIAAYIVNDQGTMPSIIHVTCRARASNKLHLSSLQNMHGVFGGQYVLRYEYIKQR